jgi:6-phosphogluconolactonase
MTEVRIYPDPDSLAEAAAQLICAGIKQALTRYAVASLVLTGGSTPVAVYARLAQEDMLPGLDLTRLHFFWGDERCVPPDHPDSNYSLAYAALLAHLPAPEQNIHRIKGELGPSDASIDYQVELEDYFAIAGRQAAGRRSQPAFDLFLLGLGEDGHTASLFPGADALEETGRWVVGLDHDRLPEPLVARVTLTLPLINTARQVIFLVSGARKAQRVREVLTGRARRPLPPAALVHPDSGETLWLLDEAAARLLK